MKPGAGISDEPILSLQQAINGAQRRAAEAGEPEELEQWLLIAGWLRELRELWARRIAMGREPDDERNAVADLACPGCGSVDCCCGDCACPQAPEPPLPPADQGCPLHGDGSSHGKPEPDRG